MYKAVKVRSAGVSHLVLRNLYAFHFVAVEPFFLCIKYQLCTLPNWTKRPKIILVVPFSPPQEIISHPGWGWQIYRALLPGDTDWQSLVWLEYSLTEQSCFSACRYGLGMIYYKQEKFSLAEMHFQKALDINPQSSVLLCHIGVVSSLHLILSLCFNLLLFFLFE